MKGDKALFFCAHIARALHIHIMAFGFVCCFSHNNGTANNQCVNVPHSRVLTALSNSSGGGEVSVLAVHVVGSTAGIITQPDAKVFHLQGRFLMNLWIKRQGFSSATTMMEHTHVLEALQIYSNQTSAIIYCTLLGIKFKCSNLNNHYKKAPTYITP